MVQIGLGLSISGFLGVVLALPLGRLADRIGGHKAWVAGSAVGGVAFLLYPLVGAFWSFVVVLGIQALTDAGRSVYTAAAVPPEVRVRTMAFVRAYLNGGFTVGAGLGAGLGRPHPATGRRVRPVRMLRCAHD
ncbi:hypothetical protein Aab01nite_10050 [Paractinoplanes abujensis]|uniref:MFS family permease n=1 Tax=Paractinoplanes abujensis TaxID=882441 RepID=A0A7W7CMC9_9ACTN|nr:MFS transporter [Actinoplanes abujensis]MBB4691168.1 MFS family permease [Actinoplanes abujensis]GID17415.1 hypothetical protein Aab01nite_10050 [Actinoplanes abujensis]